MGPSLPAEERPWRVNRELSEEEFKNECRRWNISEVVFDRMWSVYHPMLRADFKLFDEYEYKHQDKPKFPWRVTAFSAKDDGMVTPAMCRGWEEQTSGEFELVELDGNHMFPLNREQKSAWLAKIAQGLDDVMELVELKMDYEGISY